MKTETEKAERSPDMDLRAADAMARIVDDWVERGLIGSRSALADARLNYGQPFTYNWSKEERPPLNEN